MLLKIYAVHVAALRYREAIPTPAFMVGLTTHTLERCRDMQDEFALAEAFFQSGLLTSDMRNFVARTQIIRPRQSLKCGLSSQLSLLLT